MKNMFLQMQEVSITVNFLVGAPQEFVDSDKPSVETKYPGARCQVERNDTLCSNSRWQIEYLVKVNKVLVLYSGACSTNLASC
jgi:hypothetical protein